MEKKMYVVQADNEMFYCGMRHWDKQLRKAKIYHSWDYADDIVSDYKERNCKIIEVSLAITQKTKTNADRIRAMSDEELANFMAERSVNESTLHRLDKDHGLTAVQIEAIKSNVYCALRQWLKQPAEEE